MSQVSLVILSCLLVTLIIPDLALAAEEGKVLKDNKTEKPKTEAPKATPKPEPKVPKQPQPKPKIETQEPKEKPQPKKAPELSKLGENTLLRLVLEVAEAKTGTLLHTQLTREDYQSLIVPKCALKMAVLHSTCCMKKMMALLNASFLVTTMFSQWPD